jgi:Uma2 family endonuclease
MSYDEWQGWFESDERNRGEWVKGEVIQFMPPLVSHAEVVDLLHFLIGLFVRRQRLGRVFSGSIELWLPISQVARLLDIVFVSNKHADRLTSHRLEGYADLVVEVVSTDSVGRDRRQKFAEYQTAGIPEYWVVDSRPRLQSVSLYQLDANGRYQEVQRDQHGRLYSRALPSFWLDPAWLWQDPLPDPLDLLHEIMAGPADRLP